MEQLLEMPRPASLDPASPGSLASRGSRGSRADGARRWHPVCRLRELEDSWGEAALVDGRQLALFRVGGNDVFAVEQACPATQAHVMARGLVGTRGTTHTIASPLHKEVYSLSTGECFGRPELHLATYPVRVVDGTVEVNC